MVIHVCVCDPRDQNCCPEKWATPCTVYIVLYIVPAVQTGPHSVAVPDQE